MKLNNTDTSKFALNVDNKQNALQSFSVSVTSVIPSSAFRFLDTGDVPLQLSTNNFPVEASKALELYQTSVLQMFRF